MKSSFPGFPQSTLKFFAALKRNNTRAWFEAHKPQYLADVKAPMEELVSAVSADFLRFAPDYATEPKKAIYRIYRDTRFSPDKTPYKTHTSALFTRGELPRNESSAFYFEVSHEYVGIGGGAYMPSPEHLMAIRNHLARHHERLDQILAARPFRKLFGGLHGDKLQRPPKGFSPGQPGIEWIKGKQWYCWAELPAAVATTPRLFAEIAAHFRAMAPLAEFLNEPLLGLHKKARQNLLKIDERWL